MAGRSYVFHVHELESPACRHVLVTRTLRPEYSNASQSEDDAAHDWADAEGERLAAAYGTEIDAGCNRRHAHRVIGSLNDFPFGDRFYAPGPASFRIGYAPATRGHGLVVLGEAQDEAAFWAALAEDDNDDLQALAPARPAVIIDAAFRTSEKLP